MAGINAGHVRIFRGIQNATTVGAGGTITSKMVPCKFAKYVRVFVTSGTTEANALASLGFNVGMGDAPIAQNPASLGYTTNPAVGVTPRAGDGPSAMLSATAPNGKIYHDRAQATLVAGAAPGLVGPVNIDVEVVYETEADMQRSGQANAVEV